MADLTAEPYPVPQYDDFDDIDAWMAAENERLQELLDDPEETVVRFHIADGYAMYRVVDWDTPTVQHIPIGDAYSISAAHRRGLRAEDLENAEVPGQE